MKIQLVCVKHFFFSSVTILDLTGLFISTVGEEPVSLHHSLMLCVCSFGWMQFSFKLEFKFFLDASSGIKPACYNKYVFYIKWINK